MDFEIGDVVKTVGGNVGIFAGLNDKGRAKIKIVYCRPGDGRRFISNTADPKKLTLAEDVSCVGCTFNYYLRSYDYNRSYYEDDHAVMKQLNKNTQEPVSDFSTMDITKLGVGMPAVAKEFMKKYQRLFNAKGHFDKKFITHHK